MQMTADSRARAAVEPVVSPCVGTCRLDASGYCIGCLRSCEEISRWTTMGEDERMRIIERVLPGHAARRQ
ncbi:MAG: DUF1289 domain-containing protein [Rhodanobacteraceae bacterium]